MRKLITILVSFLYCISIIGQVNPDKGEVFRDDVIPRVDIQIDSDSLAWILNSNNLESNYLFHATFIFNSGDVLDTLEDVGFRLRGNTSRNADKKSFKIDFNEYNSGRKYHGLEKMNLNGQHNDPSISRAKICADIGTSMDIPMMRTNHVQFYINGEYRGIYLNVEHIDEEFAGARFGNETGQLFKCLYPADLIYKGEDPDLYKEVFWGRQAYDLKNKPTIEDYSEFAFFVKVLNLTENSWMECGLEQIFNVDSYLKAIVFDILTGNWDGPIYNKNNFYLYHNDETGLFEYIPFDLDNTLGIDWLNRDWAERDIYSWKKTSENRPLYSKILAVPKYRDRFSYYMESTIDEFFNEELLFPYLEEMRALIYDAVDVDPYYPLDYGFSLSDFYNGFDYADLDYDQTDYSIKEFIEARKQNALEQLESFNSYPIITKIVDNLPNESEALQVQALIKDDNGIFNAQLCYTFNGSTEVCIEMIDDGIHNDGEADDDIYGTEIPAFNQPGNLAYRIKAKDINTQTQITPNCDYIIVQISSTNPSLAINELMAKNTAYIQDDYSEYDDWIEIYNYGDSPIPLGDKYITKNDDLDNLWKLPNTEIQPNEFLIIWTDDDNEQGIYHSDFKLSAGGGSLQLYDKNGEDLDLIDEVDFENQATDASWARVPNGTGEFQDNPPTPGYSNTVVSVYQESFDFSIYPNPASERIHVSVESASYFYIIYDVLGSIVLEGGIHSSSDIIIENLQEGMYVIELLVGGNRRSVRKFVVNR